LTLSKALDRSVAQRLTELSFTVNLIFNSHADRENSITTANILIQM